MLKHCLILLFIFSCNIYSIYAQTKPLPSNEIQLGLQKLGTLGSVLYFAAHPDDENTRLISWLSQEKKYRTAYLSLTRGDGGQNLIGTEQGIDLGLIRTQELLAARAIDKGEQYFSSAYDFGFSKTHEETFRFWDKETALRETVFIIRKLQPDVIINRFPPDKRGGHGHHQASAILSHEAFLAAADPNMFPDQLNEVKPWQAKRLLWNTANFAGTNNTSEDQLKINIGDYNPLLGKSYGEIAALSRSQHKTQGFGAAANRGSSIEYFEHVDGTKAENDLFDGVVTSWKRITKSDKIQVLIDKLNQDFNPNKPQNSIDLLFRLKKEIQNIDNQYWKTQKLKEIDELIISCAGIWIDATTTKSEYPVNTAFDVNIDFIYRNPDLTIEVTEINASPIKEKLKYNITWTHKTSNTWSTSTQPYWLIKEHSIGKFNINQNQIGFPTNPQKPFVQSKVVINGQSLIVDTDIQYKYVDPVQGEIYQHIAIVPTITANISSNNIISVNGNTQKITITFNRNDITKNNFAVQTEKIKDWEITPNQFILDFDDNNSINKEIEIKPLQKNAASALLRFTWNKNIIHSIKTIQYDHIPTIKRFPIAESKIQYLQINNPIKKVAYINGAGDLVAQSLNQIGIETTILDEKQLITDNLQQYEAIIVGVRYFNINNQGDKILQALLRYAENGGTVIVQYNVNNKLHVNQIGPFPFNLSRVRVTEEDAKVHLDKNDPALRYPNEITEADFDNWVQERGLYFADQIDKKYRTPIAFGDKNESLSNGSMLIANYGKGKFVYTSVAFFRQLPAGVPGAYRLFVNLLSKEK